MNSPARTQSHWSIKIYCYGGYLAIIADAAAQDLITHYSIKLDGCLNLEKIKEDVMKRLTAIFAHPDDESLIAGSLARYARNGVNVSLICMTKGEAGEISDLKLASHENLGVVRERELRCACEVIGIKELHLMDYCDSGMDGTLENRKTTAFINADPQKVRFKLVKLLREIRPDVVITFEPNGWYGHPDHIAAGRFATESCRLAGIPEAFPEAGPTWEPSRLFQAVLMRSEFAPAYAYIRSQGWDSSDFDSLAIDEPDPLAEKITHVIDAHPYSDVKEQIMECHKTQFGDNHIFKKLPADLWRSCNAKEYFIQVDPAPVGQTGRESDLFAGLDGD